MKAWTSGSVAGTGTFRCTECDAPCRWTPPMSFPRAPIAAAPSSCGHRCSPPPSSPSSTSRPTSTWRTARGSTSCAAPSTSPVSTSPTDSDEDLVAYALQREWTRIGRSLAADIRFDDPTVSRRHALIVRQPDGLRVLDDRSLNGVFVNGERVEWSTLADGDEVVIGRHHLHFIDVPVVSGMRAEGSSETSSS